MHSARGCASETPCEAPGWALIQINFDPMQEIGPKVGGGCSFVNGPFFVRLTVIATESWVKQCVA